MKRSDRGGFPHPAERPQTSPPGKTSARRRAIKAGLVCLGLGLALMAISARTYYIYVPLYLVAFILSIVAMAQKRIVGEKRGVGGALLLLATLVVPVFVFVALYPLEIKNYFIRNSLTPTTEQPISQAPISFDAPREDPAEMSFDDDPPQGATVNSEPEPAGRRETVDR